MAEGSDLTGWQRAFVAIISIFWILAVGTLGLTMMYWLIKFLFWHDCK